MYYVHSTVLDFALHWPPASLQQLFEPPLCVHPAGFPASLGPGHQFFPVARAGGAAGGPGHTAVFM
jgi:hypothetical protein